MRKLLYLGVAILTVVISGIVHVTIHGGRYPFHYAAFAGDLAKIDTILAAGTPVDAQDNFGATALYYSAEQGHMPIVKRLLAAGANVNFHCDAGVMPLEAAAGRGHFEVVDVLLKAGAMSTARAWVGKPR